LGHSLYTFAAEEGSMQVASLLQSTQNPLSGEPGALAHSSIRYVVAGYQGIVHSKLHWFW
jgi:hypothetical protein